jgi:DNA mismatch endonuclease (patch repair protein)
MPSKQKRNKSIKTPSFKGLKPASTASSYAKRHNKRRDTQHEVLLRRELKRMHLRFRNNVETLYGKPDIVFPHSRVAVFCDGDFWHGRNWRSLNKKLLTGSNAAYWVSKIATNIKRDKRNTALLKKAGWHVIRVWETDIQKNPLAIARMIKKALNPRKRRQHNTQNLIRGIARI